MSAQASPTGVQRCHCHASVITPTLPHRPSLAVNVAPVTAVPPTRGATTDDGGAICTTGAGAATTAVAAEADLPMPSSFVAVALTAGGDPTSAGRAADVALGPPAMSPPPAPLRGQRRP